MDKNYYLSEDFISPPATGPWSLRRLSIKEGRGKVMRGFMNVLEIIILAGDPSELSLGDGSTLQLKVSILFRPGPTRPIGQVVLIDHSSLLQLHSSLIWFLKGAAISKTLVYCKFNVN